MSQARLSSPLLLCEYDESQQQRPEEKLGLLLYYYSFCREEDESVSHLFWDRVHVFFSFGRICIFVRVFISDYFSLVFKDVLFGFYSSHKNLKDKYFLINLFIFLAKLFL